MAYEDEVIAHIRKPGACQSLESHLSDVGALAASFADKIGLAKAGMILGLAHDFGKYSEAFQRYVKSAEGMIDPDADEVCRCWKIQRKN